MSVWNTPKQDWTIDDGVLSSDMNRVEGNINFLLNTYQLYGYIRPDDSNPNNGADFLIAAIGILVPNGYSIKILRASYFSTDVDLRFKIALSGSGVTTTSWDTTSNASEETPNFVLYSNTTGNNVYVKITLNIKQAASDIEERDAGCLVLLSKETTI